MKRVIWVIYLVLGAVLAVICGTLLSIPFNHWYTEYFVHSDDDSNFLVSTLIFGFWPISLLIGAFAGNYLYKKNIGRSTRTTRKRVAG